MVHPSNRPSFRGPIVELIGPLTQSAGETFTQALMGRAPRVIRVGENTQGFFSDTLSRRLPNGWMIYLPNEVFRTEEGQALDAIGIPPDILVPAFAAPDIGANRDTALAAALDQLALNYQNEIPENARTPSQAASRENSCALCRQFRTVCQRAMEFFADVRSARAPGF